MDPVLCLRFCFLFLYAFLTLPTVTIFCMAFLRSCFLFLLAFLFPLSLFVSVCSRFSFFVLCQGIMLNTI